MCVCVRARVRGSGGLVFVGLLLDIVEQAVCPKKKKPSPSPGDAESGDQAMVPLKSAAEDDDHLEEIDRQNRPLLSNGR